MTLPPTLSVSQTAQVMGVHEKTVRRAVARGEIPATRVGRRVLIPSHVIVRMVAAVGAA